MLVKINLKKQAKCRNMFLRDLACGGCHAGIFCEAMFFMLTSGEDVFFSQANGEGHGCGALKDDQNTCCFFFSPRKRIEKRDILPS